MFSVMWDDFIDAMAPIICFIVGAFTFPLILWRLIGEYFGKKK